MAMEPLSVVEPRLRKDEIPLEVLEPHTQALNLVLNVKAHSTSIDGLRYFRRFLSKPSISNFDIATVLAMDILPALIPYLSLSMKDYPDHMFEALWVITNIASGYSDHCKTLVHSGLVEYISKLIDIELLPADVVDQCIWAFGNIVGDGPETRDYVLSHSDVLQKILPLLFSESVNIRRNVAWAISNFFRSKPRPAASVAIPVIERVVPALASEADADVVMDLCWAMSYLSEDSDIANLKIEALLKTGADVLMVSKLQTPQYTVPCLRTLGNLVTGTDVQTEQVLKAGLVRAIHPLLGSPSPNIRKECCWILSNIVVGPAAQRTALLNPKNGLGIMQALCSMLESDVPEVCKEIWWVVANGSLGTDVPLEYLEPNFLVPALAKSLVRFKSASRRNVGVTGLTQLLCYKSKEYLRVDSELEFHLEDAIPERADREEILGLVRSKLDSLREARDILSKELEPLKVHADLVGLIASFNFSVE